MLFSGIPFLYYFLPAALAISLAAPRPLRNAALLAVSLFFYGWGEPGYVALMAGYLLLGYLFGLLIGKRRGTAAGLRLLALPVALSVGMLGYFKYADFAVETVNALTGLSLPAPGVSLPIGISFYTFQMISYTVDVYRGETAPQRNPIDLGAYVALFPQLIAGPIVRYTGVAPQLRDRACTLEGAAQGIRRFVLGLGKKVLIANQLGELCTLFRDAREPSVLYVWLYAAAFTLHIYFDFSGYSDMAIGLGRILGFRFPENFRHPYVSRSLTEFWRRWHITLGSWFRDYVYIPLGGSRVSRGKWLRNLLAVWLLTGLWHGAAWTFVLWGLYFGLLLLVEKLWLGPLLKRAGRWSHLYVLFFVTAGFVLFNGESLSQAGGDLLGMLGLGGLPLLSAEALYQLRSYAVVLLLAAVGATPLPGAVAERLRQSPAGERTLNLLEPAALGAILLVSTGYLVDGSFNPFLYFRF